MRRALGPSRDLGSPRSGEGADVRLRGKWGFSRELGMALAGPQRGMKIANFRGSGGLEVGQTSRSVQQATGQEAGPTRQQPFSEERVPALRSVNSAVRLDLALQRHQGARVRADVNCPGVNRR